MARKSRSTGQNKGGAWKAILLVIVVFWGVNAVIDRANEKNRGQTETQAGPVLAGDEATAQPGEVPAAWPPLGEDVTPVTHLTASNYYIVLDGSGSMKASQCSGGTTKIRAALSALERFVATVPADANLGLTVFDERDISERVPLGLDNRQSFAAALAQVRAGMGTPLRSAIEIGYGKLTAQAQRQLGYGEYHLVVVTDGDPDPPEQDPTPIVEQLLAESPVVLHTIGFCIGTEHVLNQPGRSFYLAADNPAQLDQGLASVLAEAPSFDAANFGE